MVQINELRIGNLLSHTANGENPDTFHVVKEIKADEILLDTYEKENDDPDEELTDVGIGLHQPVASRVQDLAGIPLDPELLKMAGFRYSNVKFFFENKEGFVINYHTDGSFYCPFIDEIEPPVFKYLHELQNFYFAMMSKELEIEA